MQILEQEPMSRHTTFRVGGPARFFLVPETEEEVAGAIAESKRRGLPFTVVGRGSNLLVSDAGYDGAVILIGDALAKTQVCGTTVRAQAGITLAALARQFGPDHCGAAFGLTTFALFLGLIPNLLSLPDRGASPTGLCLSALASAVLLTGGLLLERRPP